MQLVHTDTARHEVIRRGEVILIDDVKIERKPEPVAVQCTCGSRASRGWFASNHVGLNIVDAKHCYQVGYVSPLLAVTSTEHTQSVDCQGRLWT